MSEQQTTFNSNNVFPWPIMILISSVTFVGILSELMPSGVFPKMMRELDLNEVQVATS